MCGESIQQVKIPSNENLIVNENMWDMENIVT